MDEMETIKLPLYGKLGVGKYTLVDGDYDGEYFGQYRWRVLPNGYAARTCPETRKTIYLHQEVCRAPKGLLSDHINRNRLDNRSCNLRWVDAAASASNRRIGVRNKKGLIGVCILKNRRKKYLVKVSGKMIGTFYTSKDAALAYDMAAKQVHGDKAVLNFS